MKHLQLIENQVNKIITGVLKLNRLKKKLRETGAFFMPYL